MPSPYYPFMSLIFFPSRAKEAKKQKKIIITPDLRLIEMRRCTPGAGAREIAFMRSSVNQLLLPTMKSERNTIKITWIYAQNNPLKRMENCFQLFKNNVS